MNVKNRRSRRKQRRLIKRRNNEKFKFKRMKSKGEKLLETTWSRKYKQSLGSKVKWPTSTRYSKKKKDRRKNTSRGCKKRTIKIKSSNVKRDRKKLVTTFACSMNMLVC